MQFKELFYGKESLMVLKHSISVCLDDMFSLSVYQKKLTIIMGNTFCLSFRCLFQNHTLAQNKTPSCLPVPSF